MASLTRPNQKHPKPVVKDRVSGQIKSKITTNSVLDLGYIAVTLVLMAIVMLCKKKMPLIVISRQGFS